MTDKPKHSASQARITPEVTIPGKSSSEGLGRRGGALGGQVRWGRV
jgi:hypothetical protein